MPKQRQQVRKKYFHHGNLLSLYMVISSHALLESIEMFLENAKPFKVHFKTTLSLKFVDMLHLKDLSF